MGEFGWAGSQAVSPKGAWNRCVCSAFASKNLIVRARSPRSLCPAFATTNALAAGTLISCLPRGTQASFKHPTAPSPPLLVPSNSPVGGPSKTRACLPRGRYV